MEQSRIFFLPAIRSIALTLLIVTCLCFGSSCRQPPTGIELFTEVAPTTLPTATAPPLVSVEPSPELAATLAGPLAGVEFPALAATYPPQWPAELDYPEQFIVVETGSGTLPESDVRGWAAKLRYEGDVGSAADLLSSFFMSQGWHIVEKTELGSGGFLMLIEGESGKGTGIVVIDPDPNDVRHTRALVTVSR